MSANYIILHVDNMSCFCTYKNTSRLTSLKDKIRYRIKRSKGSVFLVGDFDDLSGRDQILRALRALIQEQLILKIGKGVYVKARTSSISNEPVPTENLRSTALELMKKLNVTVLPTAAERAYNSKQSTQVPNAFIIGVNKRISRKLKFKNTQIQYEQVK